MSSPYRSGAPPDGPRTLGRYRLLGQLAAGRFGPVWLAHPNPPGIAGPGRCVCVKQLDHMPAVMIDVLKHAARLSHRNACTAYELDAGSGTRFLAIEYVQGGPLAELGREPGLVAGIAAQVREGLRAAHALGIVHGALTADDVFVSTEGRAVILGLGTARFRPGAVPSVENDLAAFAALFGTPDAAPLPAHAIGARVALACAARIRHERALGATDIRVV